MSKFTTYHNNGIDSDIQNDLDQIISEIEKYDIRYDSIYLGGSFGRGEGQVKFDGSRWRAVNDYDLFIIVKDCSGMGGIISDIRKCMAEKLKMDFVDIGCIERRSLKNLPLSMQNYDFRCGSLLLKGEDILCEMPSFTKGELPAYEIIRLLCNRIAGLLSLETVEYKDNVNYKLNQIIKSSIAVVDAFVYLKRGYECSYCDRFRNFFQLIDEGSFSFELSEKEIYLIKKVYEIRFNNVDSSELVLDKDVLDKMLLKALYAISNYIVKGENVQSVSGMERALKHYYWKKIGKMPWRQFRFPENVQNTILFSLPFFYYKNNKVKRIDYFLRFWFVPNIFSYKLNGSVGVYNMWHKYIH